MKCLCLQGSCSISFSSLASPSVPRPSTPPSKPVAFEEFKNERGSEINRIFKENKSILNERRKRASETTQRINVIKQEIDVTKDALNFQKSLREKQGEGKTARAMWELRITTG